MDVHKIAKSHLVQEKTKQAEIAHGRHAALFITPEPSFAPDILRKQQQAAHAKLTGTSGIKPSRMPLIVNSTIPPLTRQARRCAQNSSSPP
jgi:hypothetical protein